MKTRQVKRDVQIEILRQSISIPRRVPELPVIEHINIRQNINNRATIGAKLDDSAGYSLPQSVMETFTAETGLTQEEIDQAMNR